MGEEKQATLIDILPHDEDLREWLDITGYHNVPYRSKILGRRRAIAALDAQRDKLLAEMEAEERGISASIGGSVLSSTMLPPPIPNKVEARAESASTSTGNTALDTQRERLTSNKRPHSDVEDPREGNNLGKLPRIGDRSTSQRAKEDDGEDRGFRRPRPTGFDAARRSSFDRRGEIPNFRPRYDERERSREREFFSRPPS